MTQSEKENQTQDNSKIDVAKAREMLARIKRSVWRTGPTALMGWIHPEAHRYMNQAMRDVDELLTLLERFLRAGTIEPVRPFDYERARSIADSTFPEAKSRALRCYAAIEKYCGVIEQILPDKSCLLCGEPFICNSGVWSTTCRCAQDRLKELIEATKAAKMAESNPPQTESAEMLKTIKASHDLLDAQQIGCNSEGQRLPLVERVKIALHDLVCYRQTVAKLDKELREIKQKPNVKSQLSDDDLSALFQSVPGYYPGLRAVADAALRAAVSGMPVPKSAVKVPQSDLRSGATADAPTKESDPVKLEAGQRWELVNNDPRFESGFDSGKAGMKFTLSEFPSARHWRLQGDDGSARIVTEEQIRANCRLLPPGPSAEPVEIMSNAEMTALIERAWPEALGEGHTSISGDKEEEYKDVARFARIVEEVTIKRLTSCQSKKA